MLFSGQLDLGNIRIQVGIEGMQAMILPVALVTLGVLILAMPAHRMFYGVMSLTFSIYALVGVNLGGFFIGTLLGLVGGVMAVSWIPRRTPVAGSPEPAGEAAEHDPVGLALLDLEFPAFLSPSESDAEPSTPVPTGRVAGMRAASLLARVSASPARRRQGHALVIVALAVLLGASSAGLAAGPSFADPSVTTPAPAAPEPQVSTPAPTADPAPTPTPTATPAPTPTPTPAQAPDATTPPPATPPVSPSAAVPAAAPDAAPDADAPVAAIPAARLRSASVTLEGARYIGTVAVTLADGSTRTALKITAARVGLDAFSLDSTDPAVRIPGTTATQVILGGPVTMYCTSLSGTLADGTPVVFDPATPPPLDVDLPSLTGATVGLLTVASATAALTGAVVSAP